MVQCETCSTWQHVVCLGFEDDKDKRIPENYVCYLCLVKENPPKSPENMKRLKGMFLSLFAVRLHHFFVHLVFVLVWFGLVCFIRSGVAFY